MSLLDSAGGDCCILRFTKTRKVVSESFPSLILSLCVYVAVFNLRKKERFHELASRRGVSENGHLCSIVLGEQNSLFSRAEYSSAFFPEKNGGRQLSTHLVLFKNLFPFSKIEGCVCLFALWLGSRPTLGKRWVKHLGVVESFSLNKSPMLLSCHEILLWET